MAANDYGGELDPRTQGMMVLLAGGAALVGYLLLVKQPGGGGGTPPPGGFSSPCAPLGDVDGDGRITVNDSNLIANAVAHLTVLTPDQLSRADVNRDGVVNEIDAELILQYAMLGQANIFACSRPVTHPPHP